MAFADLDTAALTEPLDAASAARARAVRSSGIGCGVATGAVLGLVAAVVAVPLSWISGWLAILPFVPAVAVWLLVFAAVRRDATRGAEAEVRIARFARDNGWRFVPEVRDPERPGGIFGTGSSRVTRDLVVLDAPRPVELGNHHYNAGYRGGETRSWGFVTTPLAGPRLPHLILQVRSGGRLGRALSVPGADDTAAVIETEGPAAAAYRVHGPVGRGPAIRALLDETLFRPDVLARLTERPVDVEVVEGRLNLYSSTPMVTLDPATWRWALALVADVAAALEART